MCKLHWQTERLFVVVATYSESHVESICTICSGFQVEVGMDQTRSEEKVYWLQFALSIGTVLLRQMKCNGCFLLANAGV